jgi:hypothetical protein
MPVDSQPTTPHYIPEERKNSSEVMNIANKVTTISYFLKDTVKNKYVYAK